MPRRRAPRVLLELAYLAGLAVALAFADLRPYEVAGLMLLGWCVVALFEWGRLRARPHYGSGLPPRWYVPRVALPPPRPLEQLGAVYPAVEETSGEATWISPASLRADWPVADYERDEHLGEETRSHDVLAVEAPPLEVEPLLEPVPEREPEPVPEPELVPVLVPDPEPLAEPEPEPLAEPEPEPEPAPEPESEPVREPDLVPVLVPEPAPLAGPEPEPERAAEPDLVPVPVPEPEPGAARPAAAPAVVATVRHRIDPLAEPAPRGRLRRRRVDESGSVEVPARPPGPRPLPRQIRGGPT
jgi:hypothetical protein